MTVLFQPLALRGVEFANRIMVSPMCQYSAVEGCATAWHHAHLLSLAGSGAALLCLEATAVTREGRITPGCLGLWDETCAAALAPVLRLIRATSPVRLAIQLAHAGRKGSSRVPWEGGGLIPLEQGGWLPEAPSAVAHGAGEPPPRELSPKDLARLREAFAAAARRAAQLDFDALELHMAHGYLLHEFLSPTANRRHDEYGGDLAGRMRFPLEVFDAVRAAFPADRPVGARVSATDWLDGEDSWTPAQTIELARQLQRRGCDWIDVSSGGISPRQRIAPSPGYQVPFARAVREATGMTTIAVGLISDARQAEEIIAGGSADMVALARALLYDPRWPWHAAAELGGTVQGPPQYWRALPKAAAKIFGDISSGQR
jgi:2,4-dienoyl-CoA reductase-like NADH-dependent reductase (Old Yellow Enzyme family)